MMKVKVSGIFKKSRGDGGIVIDTDNVERLAPMKKVDNQDSFSTAATEPISVDDDCSFANTTISTKKSRSSSVDDSHQQTSKRRSCLRRPDMPRRGASLLVRGDVELWLPYKDEPITKNTCVGFNESVRVKKVRPIRQLAGSHKELWFTEEEYISMKEKNKRLAYRVENGKTNGRKYCVRGLESLMEKLRCDADSGDDAVVVVQHRDVDARKLGWDAVLDEQEAQSYAGEYNDVRIAYKYKQTSMYSKRQAVYLASLDEQDAKSRLRTHGEAA